MAISHVLSRIVVVANTRLIEVSDLADRKDGEIIYTIRLADTHDSSGIIRD